MYSATYSVLGAAVITATVGVRQGSPTSCFLFTIFVNPLFRMCRDDGFLGWLHILMLMDDTVLLATSRDRLLEKLDVLHEYCTTHGMVINESKTKFMALNGDQAEKADIRHCGLVIKHCFKYVYLGSVFTADGKTTSSLKEHCESMQKHLHKLTMFLRTNKDIPFLAKRKVVDAAFNAAILYGCESWLDTNCRVMNTMYMTAVKLLLGVRTTTANELCLAELGLPPLNALVKHRQASYLRKLIQERQSMEDDPFIFAWLLTRNGNRRMARYIDSLLENGDFITVAKRQLRDNVLNCNKSKFITYANINPTCGSPDIYRSRDYTPEHYRIAFSRMRLSSHRLRIETGRWARLARDQRLCTCGRVQDECHVLQDCPRTQALRDRLGFPVVYPNIINNESTDAACKFVYEVMNEYSGISM
jgi:hypothetical protein